MHGTLTFTPAGNPVQCFDMFINDTNSKNHQFLLFLTARDDYSSQVAINGSPAIVTLESNGKRKLFNVGCAITLQLLVLRIFVNGKIYVT